MADSETHLTGSSEENTVKFKYTTYEPDSVVSDNKGEDNISLQEAFRRFREAKQDELRQSRLLRKRHELRKGDPQKMAALRQKFLNQAKKYFGYPYARKYWPPDSPEYKSKLFLDCCGLVRRVMRDLAEDFGFIIGPWNQAYMFDTLPKVVESEKDMKPGDLVFISATYYNPKSKKQRHNMTHVEIWAGEGCKTIGARWNNGKVQVWDHYKFLAKSYHSETYHFRSIDTWLKGICTSHCPQHFWKRSNYNPTKKSIFALPEQVEEDEAAGDDDDNVESFNMRGNTFINEVSDVKKMLSQCEVSDIRRPKTELDSPYSRINTPSLKQKEADLEFPTIRNNLKGKSIPNKPKKTKCCSQGKNNRSSEHLEEEDEYSEEAASRVGGAGDSSVDKNKTQGHLTISGSLNDLGRKGLYLRDLVDSQKVENDEDTEEESANEDDMEELEDPEEFDYDDDYFIFANDDDDDVDDDNDNVRKENDTQDHSDEGQEFKMDEAIESDIKKGTGNGAACETDMETDKDQLSDEQKCGSINKTADLKKSGKEQKKRVNVIEQILPFGPFEKSKSTKFACEENSNQNANPKVTEKHQSKEKSHGHFLKASIITVVSQSGESSGPSSSSSSSVLQSGSQSTCISENQTDSTSCSQSASLSGSQTSSSSGSVANSRAGSKDCSTSNSQASLALSDLPSESTSSEMFACEVQASKRGTTQFTENKDIPESSTVIEADAPPEVKQDRSVTEIGKRGQSKKSPNDTKTTKLPFCGTSTNTPVFYVGNGNGGSLVVGPLTSLGWRRTTNKYDDKFKLKWVQCKATINYNTFKEGDQLVNHLPNSDLLTNKLGLLNSLKQYERMTLSLKGRLPRLKLSDFHPETYKLNDKSDRETFVDGYKDNEIWICKPVGLNQGKGIFLIRSRKEVEQVLEEQEQQKQQPQRPVMIRIVQRYITNPLLLDGRKFDIRAYMLVASTVPFLILFHQGYVRLCCHRYEEDNMDLGIHLTNQYVQKKDPNYEKLKETTAWSMEKFNEYINQVVRPDCPVEIEENWVYNTFTKQMQKIMLHCFNSVKHKLESKVGYFDLFGLDFMVDTNMKIYLIEVNTNPALSCNCEALQEVIPGVIEETIYLAIECFEKSKRNRPLMPLQSLKNFTVLYCGTRQNSASAQRRRSLTQVYDNGSAERAKLARQSSLRIPPLQMQQGGNQSAQKMPVQTSDQKQDSEKSAKDVNSEKKINALFKSGKIDKKTKSKAEKEEDIGKETNISKNNGKNGKNETDGKKTDNNTDSQGQITDSIIVDSNTDKAKSKTNSNEIVDTLTKSKPREQTKDERGN